MFSKMQSPPRLAPLALAVFMALAAAPAVRAQSAAPVLQVTVAAQPLAQALTALARQSGSTLVAAPALLAGKTSAPVSGRLTLRQALDRMLAGSGLSANIDGSAITVQAVATPAAQVLAPINVSAIADATSEGTGAYAPMGTSTTATGLAMTLRETPQSISVVTQQQMRDGNMQTLDDVAAATPGITYDKLGTERSYFYSRGFQITDLQVDGIASSVAESFSTDAMSLNNMAIYDRVEVVRGANGLLQGSGNPSAVINMVRKRPTREFQMSAEAGAGSWNDYRAQADVSGPLNAAGTLRGRTVLFDNQADSFKNGAATNNKMLYAILEGDLDSATTASLGFSKQKDNHQGYDWGGFSTRADGSFYDLDRAASLAGAGSHLNRDNSTFFGDLQHRFDNGWLLTAAFNGQHSDASFLGNYPARVAGDVYSLSFVDAEYADKQLAFNLRASGPFTLFGRQHQLMLGASSRKDNFDYDIYAAGSSPQVDFNNLDFSSIHNPRFSTTSTPYALKRTEKGAVAATRLRAADALSIILGSRVSWSEYSSQSPYTNSAYDSGRQFIPYAGVVYDLDKAHALYASYTSIYSIQQYYSPTGLLDPVKGKNYEAGVKSQFFGDRLQTSLALFQTDQLNLPVALAVASTCGLSGAVRCYTEGAKVRNRGLDLEVSGSPLAGWNLASGFTYSDPEYIAGPNDGKDYNTIVPRKVFKVSTDYRLPGGQWRVGGNIQSQSAMVYTGTGYQILQGGYSLLNLHSSYQINGHLMLQLNLHNVLDKRYYQSIPSNNNYGGLFAGTPRSVAATLRYDY